MRSIVFLLTVTLLAVVSANEFFCPEKVLGKPEHECGLYGLAPLGKDDRDQRTATRAAELAIVKAGQCYTLFPDAAVGDALFANDGKQISHVTYCGAATKKTAEAPDAEPEPEPTPEDAPEPEEPATPATCQLEGRAASTCRRLAAQKEHCTSCVTSACKTCRTVFIEHCEHPTPVESVDACLRVRGEACRKKFGKNKRKADKCVRGLRRQCEEHECAKQPATPEDAPEPVPAPIPAVCHLTARPKKECEKLAKAREHCTACVTSACKACRQTFVEHCVHPTPVDSVAACLKARGDHCRNKFKSNKRKGEKCLKGLTRQCEEHICDVQPPTPEDAPEPEAVPEVPAVCELKARSEKDCEKLAKAKEHCTACVTSACKACRQTFVEHCVRPTPVANVASCLQARGDLCRKKFRNNKRKGEKCLKGLTRQCEEHAACAGEAPPPTPEAPPRDVVTPDAAPCVPRTKRSLKIRGEGKSCKNVPAVRTKLQNMKNKLNCVLKALEGDIPKEKLVTMLPPKKIIREKIKVVVPGKWVKQPDTIVEKIVEKVVEPKAKSKKAPAVKKAKSKKAATPRNKRVVVVRRPAANARRPAPVKKEVRRRPANARKVRIRRRRVANGRVTRRRRANQRKVVRRRRKVRRATRRRRNGRKVVVRRRRKVRATRRRGGRATRRRRGGRATRRRATRRRRTVRRRNNRPRPRPRNARV